MGPAYLDPKSAHVSAGLKAPYQTLVHELVHAWQISKLGGIDGAAALWKTQISDKGSYDFGDVTGKSWDDLNLEQQASVVDHWFLGKTTFQQETPLAKPMDTTSPLFRFINENLWVD